jgi:hypothetical protein
MQKPFRFRFRSQPRQFVGTQVILKDDDSLTKVGKQHKMHFRLPDFLAGKEGRKKRRREK